MAKLLLLMGAEAFKDASGVFSVSHILAVVAAGY